MLITEYKPQKLLSKTVLNLADYVINPYRGCQFACNYCYVKSFKAIKKKVLKGFEYGSFVDVKINSLDLLCKEIQNENPKSVILGASTEIYQPLEKKYQLTRNILKKLSDNNVKIYLLTKSDLITRDIDILKSTNVTVFYTINSTDNRVFKVFEKNTPNYENRLLTLQKLSDAGIKIILHVGPVLPFITDYNKIVSDVMKYVNRFEFENLNLFSVEKLLFLSIIKENFNHLYDYYVSLFNSIDVYNNYWITLKENIENSFSNKIKYEFFFHNVDDFFVNVP